MGDKFVYLGMSLFITRIHVPKSMWNEGGLKELMVGVTKSLKMGQTDDFTTFMSAVINKQAFDKHQGFLADLHSSSEVEVLAGGTADDSKGYFVEPTIAVRPSVCDRRPLKRHKDLVCRRLHGFVRKTTSTSTRQKSK